MVVANPNPNAKVESEIPSELELRVDSMTERMVDTRTRIAATPQPHVLMSFRPDKDIPGLSGLYLPLQLPTVEELYERYRNGGEMQLDIKVTEQNMPDFNSPKLLRLISNISSHQRSSYRPPTRNFTGTLKIDDEVLYDISFSIRYYTMLGVETQFHYLKKTT